jgi:hypothetical protein
MADPGFPKRKPLKRLEMVNWYHPPQLARTAVEVLVSTLFGRHADYRIIEALATGNDPRAYYDHTRPYKWEGKEYVPDKDHPREASEVWIDYVSDLGDGFNSTYTVAYYLAQARLTLTGAGARPEETRRGEILVLGGDEVYPTASRLAYEDRLIRPYEAALRETAEPHPHAYAVPGNHDWYDSLVSFSRLFAARRWFAGWRTQQCRSYFALKLPYGWWLLGTDVQLGSDIDAQQVAYFKQIAGQMQETDRIILCNAEPFWIKAGMYHHFGPEIYDESSLAFLERRVLKRSDEAVGPKVAVFLAGDLHHYRRHEAPDGTQKIIAGGGGAFLHPTHGPDVSQLADEYHLKKSFPDEATSRELCRDNFKFPLLHKSFGILAGVLYVLTARAVMADIGRYGITDLGPAVYATFQSLLISPFGLFWVVAIILGFLLFTDTHSDRYRYIAGPLHGFAHLLAIFLFGWFASYFTVSVLELPFLSIRQLLFASALIFIGGWFVGSLILGTYLFISLNVFKRHSNEAFSSLAIEDFKNFLRLKIEPNGDLTIYPIGIRKTARKWKERPPNQPGPELVPDPADPDHTAPELIEPPIRLKGFGHGHDQTVSS